MKVDKQNERLFHFADGHDRYCFDVFSGWANEEIPSHLESISVSKTNTSIDKGRLENGYYVPKLRTVKVGYSRSHDSYKIRFTLFGDKTPITFGSSKSLEIANRMLEKLIIRRDDLYSALYVPKGHKDDRFKEYVKTGDISLLNQLKKEYAFKKGVQIKKKPKQEYFEQINKSRVPKLLKRANELYYSMFNLFGAKMSSSFYHSTKNRTEAEKKHKLMVENRAKLYQELKGRVKRGDSNPKFKEFVKTGDIDLLNELKKEYGKV